MDRKTNSDPHNFINNPGPYDKVTYEERYPKRNKILNNVLEAIGYTPLIRLNKIPQSYGVKCEILVKCEYFNPGGSIKDRIILRMLNDAENDGRLKEGGLLIEPSSGNTGIGLGLVAAQKGYKSIVTIPDKNVGEKFTLMKALGIELVKTPTAVAFDDPRSYFCVAYQMSSQIPGAITLNQYSNISNPLSNYDHTAEELIDDCEGKIDSVVIGTGTGGTLTGIAAKIKEKIPSCKVVGVDPVGSIIAQPDEINSGVSSYKVEGLGHDYCPNTCVRKHVDHWVKTTDKESFDTARRMIKEEGLLIGGSSGTAVIGAIKYALAHNLGEGHRIVVVLPDSIRNYMSKFVSDDWMVDYGYLPLDTYENRSHKLHGKKVKDIELQPIQTYDKSLTIQEALKLFNSGEKAIVVEKEGKVEGAIYEEDLLTTFNNRSLKATDKISEINSKLVPVIKGDTDLSIVSKLLERHKIVLVEGSSDADSKFYRVTPKDILNLSL
jgi:cystathionine beta-synthase